MRPTRTGALESSMSAAEKRVRVGHAGARRTGGQLTDAWTPRDAAGVQSNDCAMHLPEDGGYSVKEQLNRLQKKQNHCQFQLPVPRFCPRCQHPSGTPRITDLGQQSPASPLVPSSPSSIPSLNASVCTASAQSVPVGRVPLPPYASWAARMQGGRRNHSARSRA